MGRKEFTALILVVVMISLLGLGGCAGVETADTSVEENAYKTLMSVKLTYEAAMPAVVEAYTKGLIDTEQKNKIFDGANKFLGAYRLAVASLAEYVKLKNTAAEERLVAALKDMNTLFAEFLAFISPYLIEKEGA